MIISTEYDTSLWYMMLVDEKTGKEMLDFIREIPEPLMKNVRTIASKYIKGEIEYNDEEMDYCSMDSPTDPEVYYYFDLDCEGVLSLMKYKKGIKPNNGKDYIPDEQLFELMLVPMSKEEIEMLDDEDWIGTMTNTQRQEYDFDIRPKRYGFKVTRSYIAFKGKGKVNIKKSIPINLEELPDDVTYENIMTMVLKR